MRNLLTALVSVSSKRRHHGCQQQENEGRDKTLRRRRRRRASERERTRCREKKSNKISQSMLGIWMCIYLPYIERMLWRRTGETFVCVYVCVSLWLFSGSLVFSVTATTSNIVVISSTHDNLQATCALYLSLSPFLIVECSTRTISNRTDFFLVLFLFSHFSFSIHSGFFWCSYIFIIYTTVEY